MVRLQHKTRREGGITVGKARYDLDSQGVVEVPQEAADKLVQGSKWAPEGRWPAQAAKTGPPAAAKGSRGRPPRTPEAMQAFAEAEGFAAPPKDEPPLTEPLRPPGAPAAVPAEPEEDVLELSMDNTKTELVAAAEGLGLEIPRYATKTMILELIEGDQAEE